MNRLAGESSPYLRQHGDNPVDWYPWGDDAFAEAARRDVPVLLSVGYSACHWCHVMARESFEDPQLAALLNAAFVNVKVDREERPDVDAIYMEAVQAMTGRGGWPMTVALAPDRRPFWGGTYFRPEQLREVIAAIAHAWEHRRGELFEQASTLVAAIATRAAVTPATSMPGRADVNAVLERLAAGFDSEHGGFGRAPKFPSPAHLELVLRAYMSSGASGPRRVLTTTLDAIASGGIFDHIGGGFARYSTDRQWLVPHFEKMLIDQALLVRVFRQAASAFGSAHYRQVVEDTIDYVTRDLLLPEGGFATAQDADAPAVPGDRHGVEGLHATWTPAEVGAALADATGVDVAALLEWYAIDDAGHVELPGWAHERRSIPNRLAHRGTLLRPPAIDHARRCLIEARHQRPRPALDDKVLTEWNAAMLWALADAAAVFQRPDWTRVAVANAEFLLRELRDERGRWSRSWHRDGDPVARPPAVSGDHAALVLALLRLAELTGQARWVNDAVATADTLLDWFWDPVDGGLYTTAEDADQLVVRQKDLTDSDGHSANSTAAHALLRLAAVTGEQRYLHHADRILQLLSAVASTAPGAVSNAMLAVDTRARGLSELVIAGDAPELVRLAQMLWRPDIVLIWGERFDSPVWEQRADGWAYLCRDRTCLQPVDSPEALYAQITGRPVPDGVDLGVALAPGVGRH